MNPYNFDLQSAVDVLDSAIYFLNRYNSGTDQKHFYTCWCISDGWHLQGMYHAAHRVNFAFIATAYKEFSCRDGKPLWWDTEGRTNFEERMAALISFRDHLKTLL